MKLIIANKNYSSWSLRPWVLMKTLGIPFEEMVLPFHQKSLFQIHTPQGKVPVLVDSARQNLVVWDSLAIVEYLAEQYSAVWATEVQVRSWSRSACAQMHSGFAALRTQCSMHCAYRVRLHTWSSALQEDILQIDQLWQEGLKRHGGRFLAGNALTAVDAFFAPVAFRVQTYAIPLSIPSQSYVQTLLALPAMQQWYVEALAEPWIDAPHDEAIQTWGDILEDNRRSAVIPTGEND